MFRLKQFRELVYWFLKIPPLVEGPRNSLVTPSLMHVIL